ncbi:MAG: cellobiose phosphorylase [Granulosicoccus sp.]|nr:cellobiose phosphorylase [Granulosicoccus sp.]
MASINPDAQVPLETQVERIAISCTWDAASPARPDILQHLDEVKAWFDDVHRISAEPPAGFDLAANWILDNDYLVVRALRLMSEDLPVEFFRRLPRLSDSTYQNLPRAYLLVHGLLGKTRLQLTRARLVRFTAAYQHHAALSEAELWAIPALLRIACMENLVQGVCALLSDQYMPFASNRIVEDNACEGSIERVSGAIASLRIIAEINWPDFVDEMSGVESILALDPAGVYARMRQTSRIEYRRAVETLARHCRYSEQEVAQEALQLASEADGDRSSHVGYWLSDAGVHRLERKLGFQAPGREKILRFAQRHASGLYVLLLCLVTIMGMSVPFLYLSAVEATPWSVIGVLMLSVIPASDIAVQFVNWWAPQLIARRHLYSLDRHQLEAENFLCVVAVPVIVASVEEVDSLIEKLELRYLANTEDYLRYVLLSDPVDADVESLALDKHIEKALVEGIRRLNRRYPRQRLEAAHADRFMLLHRSREYNPGEACWMAWERKRGKIEQFNAFLTEGNSEPFTLTEGSVDQLTGVKYVISLDGDTMLPPGTAAALVSMFEHPLNQPVFDPVSGAVQSGYTILQPRIETLESRESSSRFARLYSGDCAIDIYSHAVSDFHHDWFGSGSYVGKGIYHLQGFHQSMAGRVPENRILSHDLFEGLHGRVALASTIVLYESFPETWSEHCERRHRWIRGDWQLLSWLRRKVPDGSGQLSQNRFSFMDRWKLVDNLRRSIVPPVLLLYILGAWTWFPGSPIVWTVLAMGAFAPYLANETLTGLVLVSSRLPARGYLHALREQASRWAVSITVIVPDALISIDAIGRTLWRRYVSGRHLLQWRSAAHSRRSGSSCRSMLSQLVWVSPLVALGTAGLLLMSNPMALPVAAPVLLAWLLAPPLVFWLSEPRAFRRDSLNADDQLFLRRIARSTWHYFETFAGPDDNWLPPDNVQSHAEVGIAHRTSPTNIGLYLNSVLAACDLGFIGVPELVVRAENLLETVERLPAHRGQILNWYDTETLVPLEPRYVSTVDNGNFAISLVAMKQGCLELDSAPLLRASRWQGLDDTLHLIMTSIQAGGLSLSAELSGQLERLDAHLAGLCRDEGIANRNVFRSHSLAHWTETHQQLMRELIDRGTAGVEQVEQIRVWVERFDHQLTTQFRDVHDLLPWLTLLDDMPSEYTQLSAVIDELLRQGYPLSTLVESDLALRRACHDLRAAGTHDGPANDWAERFLRAVDAARERQSALSKRLREVASRAESIAWSMDFSWLYDKRSRLFHIGYNVSTSMLDSNHYDLLASEARLASFFAIAKHDVPLEHWFHLGRPVAREDGHPVLQSWSGSMFEYLMPTLFLPGKRDTLIGESESLAVIAQQRYAQRLDLPWGVSESAFAITDARGVYQYKAFGIPRLGIRRGLVDDSVVAPYASMLALGVWPKAAVGNLRELESLGCLGPYGFIDALDFTRSRVAHSTRFHPVDTVMAHHQGMSLIAMCNVLARDLMPQRVLREPSLKAVELLLQERIPWGAPEELANAEDARADRQAAVRPDLLTAWNPAISAGLPQMHLLGNGALSAQVSRCGGGGLSYKGIQLTRVSSDKARAHSGYRIHVSDLAESNDWWIGSTIVSRPGSQARTTYSQHGVEIVQHVGDMAVRLEAIVAASDDLDIRRVSIVNEGQFTRQLTLTSYAEVVLSPAADDERHPAFNKMFIGSQEEAPLLGVSFERRHRHAQRATPVLLHRIVSDDPGIRFEGLETDRHHWTGRRDRSLAPGGVPRHLSGTSGWTLDPIMALRASVTVPAGETRSLNFVTSVGMSRQDVRTKAQRYASPAIDRLIGDAPWSAAQEVHRLGLDNSELPQLQFMASLLQYPDAALRAVPPLAEVRLPEQSELWRVGISGDLPIVLLRIHDVTRTELLERLVRAQFLWRIRGLEIDLCVFQLTETGYENPLREKVMELLRDMHGSDWLGRQGGVHLLAVAHLSRLSRENILMAATVVLDSDRPLGERLADVLSTPPRPPHFVAPGNVAASELESVVRPEGLLFDNGIGGFDGSGGDYVIHLEPGVSTPAPWCNILANEQFGAIVSEAGLGCTWAQNSGEHRLTPWSNDPVRNRQGEQLWLRDEVSGELWTISPTGRQIECPVQVRHGFGRTQWLRNSHGLEQCQEVFVPVDDPVKLVTVRLDNRSGQSRRITVTFYAEWVMEAMAGKSRTHVVCGYDASSEAILAGNRWNSEFASRVAFVTATLPAHSVCGDRADFLDEMNESSIPEGLLRSDLGGRFTPGGDSCAAYQVHLDMAENSALDVTFILGEGNDRAHAEQLIRRWKSPERIRSGLVAVADFWKRSCGSLQVSSPDAGFDLMINGWLQYQSISSRLHARAGFYQAGGAFGFRDQLQDVLACIGSDPQRVRRQLLLAAAHQFEEGDVLHWWHPPEGKGVRTRISDDFLWLAYVTARYVKATGDSAVLEVSAPFLRAPLLKDDEEDRYSTYEHGESGTLFEHCRRAIDHGMRTGVHGLPLMGSGDWNDGMDRIGHLGRGESVWLAWFRIATIDLMMPIARERDETSLAGRWQHHAEQLKQAIDAHGWDGRWFVRAFDDDGEPWGSIVNDECRIDLLAQSWGVLAGFADEQRVLGAVREADRMLIDRTLQIVRLLTPPFHDTPRDPGYIKAYPPGIRENGGQYTHAAAWMGLAFAALGKADKAHEVFSMISPVYRTSDRESAIRYAREPYVLAADIGGSGLHEARGGWSWYTGAASWTWQLGVHGILGIDYLPGAVRLEPAIPAAWEMVEVTLCSADSSISLCIENPERTGSGVAMIVVDGVPVHSNIVSFPEHGQRRVVIRLGPGAQQVPVATAVPTS